MVYDFVLWSEILGTYIFHWQFCEMVILGNPRKKKPHDLVEMRKKKCTKTSSSTSFNIQRSPFVLISERFAHLPTPAPQE